MNHANTSVDYREVHCQHFVSIPPWYKCINYKFPYIQRTFANFRATSSNDKLYFASYYQVLYFCKRLLLVSALCFSSLHPFSDRLVLLNAKLHTKY